MIQYKKFELTSSKQPFALAFLLMFFFVFVFLCKGVRDCTRCLNIFSVIEKNLKKLLDRLPKVLIQRKITIKILFLEKSTKNEQTQRSHFPET